MRALALAVVLLPATALGQGVIYEPGWQGYKPGSDWVAGSSVLTDVRLETCGGSPVALKGSVLPTLTRAGTETYQCGTAALSSVDNNVWAISTHGAGVWPLHTQALLNTEALDAATYGGDGGMSVAATNVGPTGWASMDKLTSTVAGARRYENTPISSATTTTVSAWFASDDGLASKVGSVGISTGGTMSACTCRRSDGASCSVQGVGGARCYAVSTFDTTPVRMWLIGTSSVATPHYWTALAGDTTTTGSILVGFGGHVNLTYVAPYVATAGSASSVPASVVSATNTIQSRSQWCASAAIKLDHSWQWAGGDATHGFLSSGTYGSANSWIIGVGTDGYCYLDTYDATATRLWVRQLCSGLTIGTRYVISGCSNNGALVIYVNGAANTQSTGGTGNGIATGASTIDIGKGSSGTAGQISGYLNGYRLCSSADPLRCQL